MFNWRLIAFSGVITFNNNNNIYIYLHGFCLLWIKRVKAHRVTLIDLLNQWITESVDHYRLTVTSFNKASLILYCVCVSGEGVCATRSWGDDDSGADPHTGGELEIWEEQCESC